MFQVMFVLSLFLFQIMSNNNMNFPNENPVKCRVCNYVLPNLRALIVHIETHLAQENLTMEVSPIDGTKPFIKLLEKPILNNGHFNLNNGHFNQANVVNGDALDLSLKL